MKQIILMSVMILLTACAGDQLRDLDESYLAELDTYRSGIKKEKREEFLKLTGRFSLVTNERITFGASDDNNLIIETEGFPDHAGTIHITGDSVMFYAGDAVRLTDEKNEPVADGYLPLDKYGRTVLMSDGRFAWRIMSREGNYFMRIRDELNPAVQNFQGYEWFPPEARFVFKGTYKHYDSARESAVPSVFDFTETERFIGEITFNYEGAAYSLEVSDDGFLMFSDQTTGKETYGSGRYLWLTLPDKDGEVTIDFNYAYNPPCIFSEYTTCKFAPPENRLPFEVRAGEKSTPLGGGSSH